MANVSSSNSQEANVPKLRFPEFEGEYIATHIGDVFSERNERGGAMMELLSVTMNDGVVKRSRIEGKDNSSEDKSNYKIVHTGDLVYNSMRMWQGANGISKYDGIVSPAYTVLKPNQEIEHGYFAALFKTTKLINEFRKKSQGLTSDTWNLKYPQISGITVSIPKINEQIKISSFLQSLDKRIDAQRKLVDTLKSYKRGALSQLFPKNGASVPEYRFSGFTGDWEQRKLGEVANRVQGNDGRMDLNTLTISAGNGWMKQEDRFSSNIAGKEQQNYTLLKKGELSYNHGNSKLAKYGTVFELRDYEEALVPRVYHSFRVNSKADAGFVEYMFATKLPDRELGKLISSGARMDGLLNIGYDEFMSINIMMPSVREQVRIRDILRQMDTLITLHQRKLDEYKSIKQGLLEKLFI